MNYISQQEPNQMWIKKVLMLVLADILIVLISYFMALLLRFDFVFSSIPEEYLMGYLWSMPFWIISTIVIFYICRLYHSIWRLASVAELQMILIAYSILAVVYSLGMLFMQMHMPRSYYFIGFLLNFPRYRDTEKDFSNNSRMERQKQYLVNFMGQAVKAMKADMGLPVSLYQSLTDDMVTNLSLDRSVYLATEAMNMHFTADGIVSLKAKSKKGSVYDEVYVDDALYDLIIQTFYTEEQSEGESK